MRVVHIRKNNIIGCGKSTQNWVSYHKNPNSLGVENIKDVCKKCYEVFYYDLLTVIKPKKKSTMTKPKSCINCDLLMEQITKLNIEVKTLKDYIKLQKSVHANALEDLKKYKVVLDVVNNDDLEPVDKRFQLLELD